MKRDMEARSAQGLPFFQWHRHDADMRMPWSKSGNLQLDLLDASTVPEAAPSPPAAPGASARSA